MSLEELNEAASRFAAFLLPNIKELVPNFPPIFDNVGSTEQSQKSKKKRSLARSSLKVTPEITPGIDSIVCDVANRLHINRRNLDVFVFPSTDLNAFCYIDELPITVGLSSYLVKSLKREELAFVIGHEVGHVFFKEISNFSPTEDCIEDLIIARTVELTVDRIGLVATRKIEGAFGAILKILSGLNDNFLRHDFNKFLHESQEVLGDASADDLIYSTHPPLALRFKSLVSFSTTNEFLEFTSGKLASGISLKQANNLILTSLDKAVDNRARLEIDVTMVEIGMWTASLLLLSKKSMSLGVLKKLFSPNLTKSDIEKSYIYVTNYSKDLYSTIIQEKLFAALAKGYSVAPRRTYAALVEFVKQNPEFKLLLNSPDFFKNAPKIIDNIL